MTTPLEYATNVNKSMKKQYVVYEDGMPLDASFVVKARARDAFNYIDQMPKEYLQQKTFRDAVKNTDGLPAKHHQGFVKYIHDEFVKRGLEK